MKKIKNHSSQSGGGSHGSGEAYHSASHSHSKHEFMDKVKIKRIKRNKKKVTTGEKIMAGIGVGSTLLGGSGVVTPKVPSSEMTRREQTTTVGNSVKTLLNRVFGIGSAQAAGLSVDEAQMQLDQAQKVLAGAQQALDDLNKWYSDAQNELDTNPYYNDSSVNPNCQDDKLNRQASIDQERNGKQPGLQKAVADAQAMLQQAQAVYTQALREANSDPLVMPSDTAGLHKEGDDAGTDNYGFHLVWNYDPVSGQWRQSLANGQSADGGQIGQQPGSKWVVVNHAWAVDPAFGSGFKDGDTRVDNSNNRSVHQVFKVVGAVGAWQDAPVDGVDWVKFDESGFKNVQHFYSNGQLIVQDGTTALNSSDGKTYVYKSGSWVVQDKADGDTATVVIGGKTLLVGSTFLDANSGRSYKVNADGTVTDINLGASGYLDSSGYITPTRPTGTQNFSGILNNLPASGSNGIGIGTASGVFVWHGSATSGSWGLGQEGDTFVDGAGVNYKFTGGQWVAQIVDIAKIPTSGAKTGDVKVLGPNQIAVFRNNAWGPAQEGDTWTDGNGLVYVFLGGQWTPKAAGGESQSVSSVQLISQGLYGAWQDMDMLTWLNAHPGIDNNQADITKDAGGNVVSITFAGKTYSPQEFMQAGFAIGQKLYGAASNEDLAKKLDSLSTAEQKLYFAAVAMQGQAGMPYIPTPANTRMMVDTTAAQIRNPNENIYTGGAPAQGVNPANMTSEAQNNAALAAVKKFYPNAQLTSPYFSTFSNGSNPFQYDPNNETRSPGALITWTGTDGRQIIMGVNEVLALLNNKGELPSAPKGSVAEGSIPGVTTQVGAANIARSYIGYDLPGGGSGTGSGMAGTVGKGVSLASLGYGGSFSPGTRLPNDYIVGQDGLAYKLQTSTTLTGPKVNGTATALTFVNLSSNNTQTLIVGDQWKITINGPVGAKVYATSTVNGKSSTAQMGIIGADGSLVLTGTVTEDLKGPWTEMWQVGSDLNSATSLGSFSFNVIAGLPAGFAIPPGGFAPGTTLPNGLVVGSDGKSIIDTSTGTIVGKNGSGTASATASGNPNFDTTSRGTGSSTGNGTGGNAIASVTMSLASSSLVNRSVAMKVGEVVTIKVQATTNGVANNRVVASSSSGSILYNMDTITGTLTIIGVAKGTASLTLHPSDASGTSTDQTLTVTVSEATATSGNSTGGQNSGTGTGAGAGAGTSSSSDQFTAAQLQTLSVRVSQTSVNMNLGDSPFAVVASVSVAGQTNYNFTAASSNTSVITVNIGSNGVVQITPVGGGQARVILHPTAMGSDTSKDINVIVNIGVPVAGPSTYGGGVITSGNVQVLGNAFQGAQLSSVSTNNFQGLQMPTSLQMPAGYPSSGGLEYQDPGEVKGVAGLGYTVKKGDTLYKIAEKVYGKGNGKQWREILAANPKCLSRPGDTRTLKVGYELTIPN